MNDPKDHDILVGLVSRFDAFASEMRDKVNAFIDGHKDHEMRIRLLERDNENLKGQIEGVASSHRLAYALFTLAILGASTMAAWALIFKK